MQSKAMTTKTIVLYPGLAASHFVPMMRLADAFMCTREGLSGRSPIALGQARLTPEFFSNGLLEKKLQLVDMSILINPIKSWAGVLQQASHLFGEMLEDPESEIYQAMMSLMRRNVEADGILENTFESLEPRAVAALGNMKILDRRLPPVYCVGPLVVGAAATESEEKHECLAWLDGQPEHSVVFLCFGSIGAASHSAELLREIAVGLERSGHRFLWVVRAPLDLHADPGMRLSEPDVEALLPDGFLERTRGRGRVVKLWAPPVEVLHHKATGAFVTHCGWNSVLEGVTAGVPMLCWPLYAEQKMNKVFMVEEAGIAVEVVGWQKGLVKAEEVEAKVRLVLESDDGERLRARVTAHKDAAAMAWEDGGSSRAAFAQFLSDVDSLAHAQGRHRNGKLG